MESPVTNGTLQQPLLDTIPCESILEYFKKYCNDRDTLQLLVVEDVSDSGTYKLYGLKNDRTNQIYVVGGEWC